MLFGDTFTKELKQNDPSHGIFIQFFCKIHFFIVCLICSLRPSQQFFSYVGTGLPGFNQH